MMHPDTDSPVEMGEFASNGTKSLVMSDRMNPNAWIEYVPAKDETKVTA